MSNLQRQLTAIAAKRTDAINLKSQRASHGQSLVWDANVAAHQSFDTIYLACLSGFEALSAIDKALLKFENSLFGRNSVAQDREQMTLSQNDEVSKVIKLILPHLSQHLRQDDGLLAMEWLVRRFR
jgi:U3 small nucleolar RNA-associated protein 10